MGPVGRAAGVGSASSDRAAGAAVERSARLVAHVFYPSDASTANREPNVPQDHFTDIALEGNTVIVAGESRALLERVGIGGEILQTPGHSDDRPIVSATRWITS
jgi:hypothetical protein